MTDLPSRDDLALCAHDVRSALTVVAGYAEMLRGGRLSAAEQAEALDGIDAAVKRADAMLGDTLAGRPHRSRSARVELAALAERAATDARATHHREIIVSVTGSPCVAGDDVALARVLENLLGNAAKYAPEGPIELSIAERDGRVIVDVADQGPGIPEDQRESIFEPFARLKRDDELPGTGLGLAVVRGVAERLGGSASALPREGGGLVMRLDLPAAS